jgi:hypothetical protein
MALDDMATKLVKETQEQLVAAQWTHDCEVRISPRRMRALILAQQQRMAVQVNGISVVLVEDADAPDFADAIAQALAPVELAPPEPTTDELAELAEWRAFKAANEKREKAHL